MSRYKLIAILLVLLHLCLSTAFSIANPLGEAPDEADHWAYIVYLAKERSLPEGPRVTQSKHPPFYHATAAAVASFATPDREFLRANPDVSLDPGPTQSPNFFIHTTLENWPWQAGPRAFHLARLWSVLLSSATVAAVFGLARSAFPTRPGVALLATGLAATLPEFAFIGGAANNDNTAALFGTLALWGGFAIYQARGNWRAGWWTPIVLGLGLLSKASTLSLWPVVALCIALGTARPPHDEPVAWREGWANFLHALPRSFRNGLIIFLPAIVIASPWLLRNWRLYGDPSGIALVRETIDLRTTPWTWSDTLWLFKGWFSTFWGKFGAVGHLEYPAPVYWFFAFITAAGIAGVGMGMFVVRRRAARERLAILLLLLAVCAVAFGMWRYSLLALGTDQGRLLFPAIGPILLLLAFGLTSLPLNLPLNMPVAKVRLWLGSALVAGMAALSVFGVTNVMQPAFAPPPTFPSIAHDTAPNVSTNEAIPFGELQLRHWTLDDHPVLYWQALQSPTQDWRTSLRVTAEDGTFVWEWRRSPGYGRFSTDHWDAGTIVRDEYLVQWPEWTFPGRYRVEVALYPFGAEAGLEADSEYPYVHIGWLSESEEEVAGRDERPGG